MSDQENQSIISRSDLRKYRTELPNLYDDSDLDPYEFRLLAHYVRRGNTFEKTRVTATHCKMSPAQVVRKRRTLEEKRFVILHLPPPDKRETIKIEIVDRWDENFSRYSSPSKEIRLRGKQDVSGRNEAETDSRLLRLRGGTKEYKNEPIKDSATAEKIPSSKTPAELKVESDRQYDEMESMSADMPPAKLTGAGVADPTIDETEKTMRYADMFSAILDSAPIKEHYSAARKMVNAKWYRENAQSVDNLLSKYRNGSGAQFRKDGQNAYFILTQLQRDLARNQTTNECVGADLA